MFDERKKQTKCFVGGEIAEWRKEQIREDVCRELPVRFAVGDKNYCLLHAPTVEKAEEFSRELEMRLKADDFDHRGVYFPQKFEYYGKSVDKNVDLSYAYFADGADFKYCNFNGEFEAANVRFAGVCDLEKANFKKRASFSSAVFEGNLLLHDAKFEHVADFIGARFGNDFFASKTEFHSHAYFNETQFKGETSFEEAKFNYNAVFQQAQFHDTVSFMCARLGFLDCRNAVFATDADFTSTNVLTGVNFHGAKSAHLIKFDFSRFPFEIDEVKDCFNAGLNVSLEDIMT
ncbi:MAG TPA: pentapeptide repeat-containing protein [Pyrinomonadaceae bacterium]|nr:pentapeptide repeat-containing protein [Pyrinomonadaceae bacterium]